MSLGPRWSAPGSNASISTPWAKPMALSSTKRSVPPLRETGVLAVEAPHRAWRCIPAQNDPKISWKSKKNNV